MLRKRKIEGSPISKVQGLYSNKSFIYIMYEMGFGRVYLMYTQIKQHHEKNAYVHGAHRHDGFL